MTRISAGMLALFVMLGGLVTSTAQAYLAIGESGEVIKPGHYQVVAQPQFFTNEDGGANLLAGLDTAWADGMSSRFSLGAGKFSPTLGASFKWIPFPDVDRQPAIGFKTAAWYGRYNSENYLTFQFAPLISRKFDTDQGLFIPYLAVPLNYTNTKSDNYGNQQFVLGTEYKNSEAQNWTFGGELSINLNKSFSYLLFTVGYEFDGDKGLQLKRR